MLGPARSLPRNETLAAHRAFDSLRIDAADSGGRDRVSAFCADRIERRLNFFQIDFRLAGHVSYFTVPDDLNMPAIRKAAPRTANPASSRNPMSSMSGLATWLGSGSGIAVPASPSNVNPFGGGGMRSGATPADGGVMLASVGRTC